MARKMIAYVFFVLVTLQYFYFYRLISGVATTTFRNFGSASSAAAFSNSTSLSASGSSSSALIQTANSRIVVSVPLPPRAWKQPQDNSVVLTVINFNSLPSPEDSDGKMATSLQEPEAQPMNLLNQASSRLNESSMPNQVSTRLNKTRLSEQEKVRFSHTNHSDSLLVSQHATKFSETGKFSESSLAVSSQNQRNIISNNLSDATTLSTLPLCPSTSPLLTGFIRVTLQAPSLADIGRLNNDIEMGGHYRPAYCRSRSRVAIIVPFRDRENHLRVFLHNLIPMLKRQQIEFNIFVIEQGGSSKNEPFNRATLFNVGFVEANKRYPWWECFIFHDVDMIPENDHNLYDCPVQPRHDSEAVDKVNYGQHSFFGGVSTLTKEHFLKVNGFSNVYWGWGGEDDDMFRRIPFHGLSITRTSQKVGRYKMLKHRPQTRSKQRHKLLAEAKHRFKYDGLSNLNYTVESLSF